MTTLQVAGATAMGVVVGYLIQYFLHRFDDFTPQGLGVVISTLSGGAVLKFIGRSEVALWCYPIGILVGMLGYAVVAYLLVRKSKKDSSFDLADYEKIFLGTKKERNQ